MPRKMLIWTARVVAAVFLLVAGLALHVELDRLPRFRHGAPEPHVEVRAERSNAKRSWLRCCVYAAI